MSKIMLVNVTHVEESRVVILDNGVLDAYEIETTNRAQIRGNIYNAVVENVHATLEAAFLRITPDQKGFLPLDEVNFNLLPSRGESRKSGRIGQHLHQGQKILAQVVREPFSGKPPTVSTYFSLPGRYLVLMPGVDSAGVSRKIEDAEQRDRLKKIVEDLPLPEGFGLIVRTAGLGQTKAELQRDLRYLLRLWQSIQRNSQASEFPALVYREADLVIRTIRDHLTPDIDEVWIDSQDTYDRAEAFARDVMPGRSKVLRLYTGDRPLFNKFNLEEQIETIYKRRVPLPSGGEIVIDGTEALTAIDVNTARSKRKGDAEESVLQTNLEAATEIARQLRLRDLGGLIVVDFIDMASTRNKKKVEDEMKHAMRGDKAKHDLTRLSKMGLMEIARQRLKGAKMAITYNTCPACDGYGLIKTLESAALSALRKLQTRSASRDIGRIKLALPVDVASWMLNHKREDLLQIERRNGLRVEVEPEAKMLRHETLFETFPVESTEAPAARIVAEGRGAPPLPPTDQEVRRAEVQSAAAGPPAAGESPRPAGEPRFPGEASRAAGDPRPVADPRSAVETPRPTGEPGAEGAAPRRRRRRRRRSSSTTGAPAPGEAAPTEERESFPAESDEEVAPSQPLSQEENEPSGPGSPGAEGDPEFGPRKKRRRRRRRPRPADGQDASSGQNPVSNGADVPKERAHDEPPPIVPRGVRSDELMPAATGSRSRRGGDDDGGSRRRRRRGGGSSSGG